jgi:hypothetical protein
MRFVRRAIAWSLAALALGGAAMAGETIVLVRHGEKPEAGLGQLDCQGLNRSLKLPGVISAKFGRPAAILAPDPAKQKEDGGVAYDYVRPLATVEPTAIAFGLPVSTQIGLEDISGLKAELEKPDFHDALILVGWEHKIINEVECQMLTGDACDWKKDRNGDKRSGEVSKWDGDDFDRIDVIKIDWSGAKPAATIAQSSEGLNGQPQTCPK